MNVWINRILHTIHIPTLLGSGLALGATHHLSWSVVTPVLSALAALWTGVGGVTVAQRRTATASPGVGGNVAPSASPTPAFVTDVVDLLGHAVNVINGLASKVRDIESALSAPVSAPVPVAPPGAPTAPPVASVASVAPIGASQHEIALGPDGQPLTDPRTVANP